MKLHWWQNVCKQIKPIEKSQPHLQKSSSSNIMLHRFINVSLNTSIDKKFNISIKWQNFVTEQIIKLQLSIAPSGAQIAVFRAVEIHQKSITKRGFSRNKDKPYNSNSFWFLFVHLSFQLTWCLILVVLYHAICLAMKLNDTPWTQDVNWTYMKLWTSPERLL